MLIHLDINPQKKDLRGLFNFSFSIVAHLHFLPFPLSRPLVVGCATGHDLLQRSR